MATLACASLSQAHNALNLGAREGTGASHLFRFAQEWVTAFRSWTQFITKNNKISVTLKLALCIHDTKGEQEHDLWEVLQRTSQTQEKD